MWQQLHELLLAELRAGDVLDLSRASVDGSHLRALKGGDATGRSPVDRGKTGSKHHVIVDAHGIPLAATVTGGNRNDVTQLLPLIHAVPPIRGKRGRPRRRPGVLYADRGYDHDISRPRSATWASARSSPAAAPSTAAAWARTAGSWKAAFALLHWFRRLHIRWEIRDDIHEAFLSLACGIICWRRLRNLSLC